MNNTQEINGTYGGSKTKSTIFTYQNRDGSTWYVADGSVNVNCTYDEINEGVDIEELSDFDIITANKPIESIEDLVNLIED